MAREHGESQDRQKDATTYRRIQETNFRKPQGEVGRRGKSFLRENALGRIEGEDGDRVSGAYDRSREKEIRMPALPEVNRPEHVLSLSWRQLQVETYLISFARKVAGTP